MTTFPMMKTPLKSLTIQGALLTLLPFLDHAAPLIGLPAGAISGVLSMGLQVAPQVAEIVVNVVGAVGSLLAILGRLRAEAKIVLKK